MPFAFTGCGGRHAVRTVTPVPSWRYPEGAAPRQLQLVSLYGDPYGASFAQGPPPAGGIRGNDRFLRPSAAAVSPAGDVFVLDRGRGVLYRMRYGPDGALVETLRIDAGGTPFPSAVDMAIDRAGNAWVVDSKLAGVFGFSAEGEPVARVTGAFQRPVGIAAHPSRDAIFVTDIAGDGIFEIALDGRGVGSIGAADGLAIETPSFIDIGPDGSFYIVEALASRIAVFYPDWTPSGTFGGPGDGPGYFSRPKGIAVDRQSLVYVADGLFDNVQVFNRDGELLLALGTSGQGPAQFWQPAGVSIDNRGRLLIADAFNARVQVFEWRAE